MEILNDSSWGIRRKEEGMAIRGYNSRQVNSSEYSPVHIKSIIQSLGIDMVGETSNDYLAYCPFHSNRHTSSFSVSKTKGAYLCFNPSCGEAGTLSDLVKKILNKNEFQSLRYIESKQSEALENFDESLKEILEDKPDFVEFPEETLVNLHKGLINSNKGKDYLKSRGIDLDSIKHFSLGYSDNMDMITVPVHSPDGIPVGVVGRSISDKRFKNSKDLPRSKTMFNIHRAKKIGDRVIVVESSFDAIRVHQAGFPNVVATLGGHISGQNLNLLNRYFNTVIIMTDADKAGRDLGSTIAYKLSNKNILWASHSYGRIYPEGVKDAGDMSDEDIKACIANAISNFEYKN